MTTTPKTLTTGEAVLLLEQLLCRDGSWKQEVRGIRNYTMACLMLYAGLRVGEVVQLRTPDLAYNNVPVVSITIRPEIAKNKKERVIPVCQTLQDALKKFFRYNGTRFTKWGGGFAFTQIANQRPVTTRQVERVIRAAAMKILGRPVHPHVLRHTFATRLMRRASSRIVQELLGHESMVSTQIYMSPNSDDLRNAINGFDEGENPLRREPGSGPG